MCYDIHIHQHRFAAWAACRAASTRKRSFNVSDGAGWLASAGLNPDFQIESIPENLNGFDKWHRDMRARLVRDSEKNLSHGQAAKLINCYLKARFLNSLSAETPAMVVAHPPIDAVLLSAILKANLLDRRKAKKLRDLRGVGWSNWKAKDYKDAIDILRKVNGDQPFWMIEKHWRGYQ
jgi:hypothetical protein